MKKYLLLAFIACIMVSCKPDLEQPTVVSFPVSDVSDTTAVSGGNVTADGGAEVTAKGVCWSTNQNPTIDDSHTTDGTGVGSFTSAITSLSPNTTYYVRAYATNSEGTSYGNENIFTTLEANDGDDNDGNDDGDDDEIIIELPIVATIEVTEITETSATVAGEVTSDGGAEVTARGICWSTSQNPTIENDKTVEGGGLGSFQSNLMDLSQNTTYYVRAYATNSEGTAYGEEISFTTLEEIIITIPAVVTLDVTEITETSALVAGEVTADGGAEVTARGVCWNTNPNPTTEDSHTTEGTGTGSFVSSLPTLSPNTTYYARAYATNSEGTAYGEEISFTTLEIVDDGTSINGYKYVDLGLPSGLKWAEYNIGATASHEYGNYYAWGEINTKDSYTTETSLTFDVPMTDISGDPQYDAASANWGASWRMPTKEDFDELVNECTWEWTEIEGKNGSKVTGPNGNSIFIPAAGFRQDTNLFMSNVFGYLWSGSWYEHELDYYSYMISFMNGFTEVTWENRTLGHPIRPVSE